MLVSLSRQHPLRPAVGLSILKSLHSLLWSASTFVGNGLQLPTTDTVITCFLWAPESPGPSYSVSRCGQVLAIFVTEGPAPFKNTPCVSWFTTLTRPFVVVVDETSSPYTVCGRVASNSWKSSSLSFPEAGSHPAWLITICIFFLSFTFFF